MLIIKAKNLITRLLQKRKEKKLGKTEEKKDIEEADKMMPTTNE